MRAGGKLVGPRPDRGAAVVEFALVVPLLVLLVVGIAEFGRAYYLQTTISGAAREAVRVMAIEDDPEAARAKARDYLSAVDLNEGEISVSPTSCGASEPGTDATVEVTYPMDFITGLFGADLTLTGRGVMRCNG